MLWPFLGHPIDNMYNIMVTFTVSCSRYCVGIRIRVSITGHSDTIIRMCSPPSCDLLCPDPVVAVLPLPADVTASCPIHHIFGGFRIYVLLNVEVVVRTIVREVFLYIPPSESNVNKKGADQQQ